MPKFNIRGGEWSPNGLQIRNYRGKSVIKHAQDTAKTLGTYKAARYLRSRGWSIEAALHILTKSSRDVTGWPTRHN